MADGRRISVGKLPQRQTTAAIQGHLQVGSEGLRNGPQQMGRSAWRQAMHHSLSQFEETLVQQAKAKRQSRNQQNQGADRGQMDLSSVWKGLSVSNWSSQPY